MMTDLETTDSQIQSNEYILQNDWALTNFFVGCYSILLIFQCLVFSPFHHMKGDIYSQWFWDEFKISYGGTGSKCMWYTIGGAFFWWLDSYLFTYGTFKVVNAPVVAILDISDIFFTFILSYVWLHQSPDSLEIIGSILIIVAIGIAVYPWQKQFIQGSKYQDILKNF